MTPTYGVGSRPREQWPIIAPKGERDQEDWIVACFCDDVFTLTLWPYPANGAVVFVGPKPYSELWQALAGLPRTGKKRWLIGHRTRYALERAGLLQALEGGKVSLPTSTRKGKVKKRSGKIAYSLNCLEIDLVCGKNRIKVIDWKNYGFEPEPGPAQWDMLTQNAAVNQLADWQAMGNKLGVRLNKTTAAQIGWQHARIDYAPPVLMYNLDAEARAMERRAYYGGRNEPYRLGDILDCVMSLDVKSSYGKICQTCRVPIYMEEEFLKGLDHGQMHANNEHQWIADVVIATNEPDYPLRVAGQVIYPIGSFYTSLAWPELKHALDRGRVSKVVRAARYRADFALAGFAAWYMQARDFLSNSQLPHLATAIKAIFNGGLGYTARQRYELVPWTMDIDRAWWLGYTSAPDQSAPIVHAQVLDGVKEWLKIGGEPREAMPFLHATICSWARLQLLNIMQQAGKEWVYYCDTDGILVDYRGWENLAREPGWLGDQPGQLHQRFPSGPCRIQGQKNYRIGDNVICSGLVKTRYDRWQEKQVLTTNTGRIDAEGRVHPFQYFCEAVDGEQDAYTNIEC